MKSFEIDLPSRGGVTHALEWGPSDRPVDLVFLHANGFNARTYRVLLEPLGERLRVVAIDQRGHGGTRLPTVIEGREDWLDLRDDLLALSGALEIENAVLAGHSMGGTVAVLAAAAAPSIARGLVLFDPVILPAVTSVDAPGSAMITAAKRRRTFFPNRLAAAESYRGRGAFRGWPETMLSDYLADGMIDQSNGDVVLACPPAWEASNYASHGHDTRAALAALAAPFRVLKAERDSAMHLTDAEVAAYPTVSVEIIPGTSHFLPMEQPDLARAALLRATVKA